MFHCTYKQDGAADKCVSTLYDFLNKRLSIHNQDIKMIHLFGDFHFGKNKNITVFDCT